MNRTGKNFLGVAGTIFVAKVLGFIRDIFFAFTFGTTAINDAFQTIFSVPSLLFSNIGTALSSVNIPDLTYYLKKNDPQQRNEYIAALFAQVTLAAAVLSLAGIILAPWITAVLAPGLTGEINALATILCRIMMPTLLLVNITYLATGILQVHGHFIWSSVISIPFNLLIIITLILADNNIIFLGYVITLGWALQFLIQCPVLVSLGYRFIGPIRLTSQLTKNLYKNVVPIILGNSLLQLCLISDRAFSTQLGKGAASAMSFGGNLFLTITSIFIVAMSTVIFPGLSRFVLNKETERIKHSLNRAFQMLLFILLPYLIAAIAYHQEIISLIYERGAFTDQSTLTTSLSFMCYSFAVFGYACQELFNRVYYALKNFHIPMRASLVCLAMKLGLNIWFAQTGSLAGISLSTAFCLAVYAIILYVCLKKELGNNLIDQTFPPFILKLMLPLSAMTAIVCLGKCHPVLSGSVVFLMPLGLSGLVYLGLSYIMGLKELFAKH